MREKKRKRVGENDKEVV